MLRSTRFQAIVLVAVGALLGYAAASSNGRWNWQAKAEPSSPASEKSPATRATPSESLSKM
jgi:hypothetical protein